jgi:Zinc-binding dehydrogenase
VQIAKARGAHVIALASAANADFVRLLGADEAIDYAATDFTEVRRPRGRPGGDRRRLPRQALEVLKPGGTLVSTLPPTLVPVAQAAADRRIRVGGVLVEADRLGMSALAGLAASGKLVPTVAATFPSTRSLRPSPPRPAMARWSSALSDTLDLERLDDESRVTADVSHLTSLWVRSAAPHHRYIRFPEVWTRTSGPTRASAFA